MNENTEAETSPMESTSAKVGVKRIVICNYCDDKGAYTAHGETLTCPYCTPRRTIQDDFIFVFKKGMRFKVFGVGDAKKFKDKLAKDGFVHSQTLSASVVFENLLNIGQSEKIDLMSELLGR